MDEQETLRLTKEYAVLSDEDILDMLKFDKDEYEQGVYQIIAAEAKRRGIDKTQDPVSVKSPAAGKDKKKWFAVYKFSDLSRAEALETFLNTTGIGVDIVQDGCYSCSRSLSPVPETGVIRVREDQVDQARKLVAEFEELNPDKNIL